MVRTYKRKTVPEIKYDPANLTLAIQEVSAGRMTYYRACKTYQIPFSTLYSRVKGTRGAKSDKKGKPTALLVETERKIVEGIRVIEKWGFGLTRKEIIELVGQHVKANNIKTPFKDNVPGSDWFVKFKQRHNLSIKVPQSVEYARKQATDPFIIYGYFDLLKKFLDDLQLHDKPNQIWNLDESSFSIDPSRSRVVGIKGHSSSRIISSPGRENTTVLLAANAKGEKAPPLIVYKGANVWDQWMTPPSTGFPGTVYAASRKGWMESPIFLKFFKKTLIPCCGDARPVLLIYDGHCTHVGPEVVETALSEGITILKLTAHSSHLLQPLDLSVFKALTARWDVKLLKWQRHHIGQKLPKKIFAQFL